MRELIGKCYSCGKSVYCEDGFFDGAHEDGKLWCENCDPQAEEKEKDNN